MFLDSPSIAEQAYIFETLTYFQESKMGEIMEKL